MNKSDWKTTAELIGIAAIVVSLVFVGLQVRQEYRVADAQRDTDFNASQIEIANLITENDALWRKGLAGDELTPEEETSFEAIVHVVDSKYQAMMSRAENLGGRPVVAFDPSGDLFITVGRQSHNQAFRSTPRNNARAGVAALDHSLR